MVPFQEWTDESVDEMRGHVSEAEHFWAAYCGARFMALSLPLTQRERIRKHRAAVALSQCLGMDARTAAYHARRCLLYRREAVLHEIFALNLAPSFLLRIVEAMEVAGADRIKAGRGEGLLMISLHYSLYSSLLVFWLARATACGLFRNLAVLVLSTPTGSVSPSQQRLALLQQGGIWSAETRLIDRRIMGSPWSARRLISYIKMGGAVLILPDATFVSTTNSRAVTLKLGKECVAVPRGAAWLVQQTDVPLISVHVHPYEDRHAIVFDSSKDPDAGKDSIGRVRDALQHLIEQTVLVDPGPWEGWLREGFTEAISHN
jgi:hypothetical protein